MLCPITDSHTLVTMDTCHLLKFRQIVLRWLLGTPVVRMKHRLGGEAVLVHKQTSPWFMISSVFYVFYSCC